MFGDSTAMQQRCRSKKDAVNEAHRDKAQPQNSSAASGRLLPRRRSSTQWVYSAGLVVVSARTNKRHHHHHQPVENGLAKGRWVKTMVAFTSNSRTGVPEVSLGKLQGSTETAMLESPLSR
jgi:hypothetical protein